MIGMSPTYHTGRATVLRGDASALPLPDSSVDLIVTSPPYWSLRSYTDGGDAYAGQIGAEPTWQEYIDNLIRCTREWSRVLKPTGSMFVNLGDKYSPAKSLMDLPWRYSIRCVDELGLIKRAEILWSKLNGLPESVTDRVRRSHEVFLHLTKQPRYFSAVDEIREQHSDRTRPFRLNAGIDLRLPARAAGQQFDPAGTDRSHRDGNPLGKLPGSVWEIATEPLKVPAELGIDHFAAFPTEWPRRIIAGWSPSGICTACGEVRRPVSQRDPIDPRHLHSNSRQESHERLAIRGVSASSILRTGLQSGQSPATRITGEACACPDTTAPTRPSVVLDPFGGTGTTALVASVLGRHGISVDMSADYCRLARWRTADPGQRAKASRVTAPPKQIDGQGDLFAGLGVVA